MEDFLNVSPPEILSLRLCISDNLACIYGLKAVAFFSHADMMQVESPKQDAKLNPPSQRVTAFAISLEHKSNPETSALGIVKPVLSEVIQAFAASMCDLNL